MSDMERAIVDVNPDCLIIDTTAVGAAAVAEASALPWAQWIPFFQHVGVDAISPRQIARIPFTLTPAGMEVLNAPRRRLGLDPLVPTEAYPAPLYLYFTAEPFECEGLEFPSSFRLVGPGLWEPPGDAQEWPQAFDRPLVLVTASSEFQRDDALIESALRGLASEEVCLVISTVAHDPRSFEVPPNARVTRWLAHSELIEKAACVVCHGGMGITQRALAAGVPVCVVPFGRDQIEVALRVTATASGTHLPADALSPTAAREAIRQAMTMAAGAERVAEGFTRAGGPSAAAEALQSLLTTKQGSRGAHRVSPLTTPPGASPDGAQLVT
jgi:MGT family glycosyltransferase